MLILGEKGKDGLVDASKLSQLTLTINNDKMPCIMCDCIHNPKLCKHCSNSNTKNHGMSNCKTNLD